VERAGGRQRGAEVRAHLFKLHLGHGTRVFFKTAQECTTHRREGEEEVRYQRRGQLQHVAQLRGIRLRRQPQLKKNFFSKVTFCFNAITRLSAQSVPGGPQWRKSDVAWDRDQSVIQTSRRK
jgi:hypothetical protein